MFGTPVLFLIFNRPDLTEKVFAAIKEAKPTQLFLAADGPRRDKPGEELLCAEARQVVLEHIDWDCDLKILFRDENLGCKLAVSSAITWFFENVEEGIILEDDTLPSASFFPFCADLLQYYRTDERVSFISGTCIPNSGNHVGESYYFSKFSIIWGWASWRRAWQNYDVKITDWETLSKTNWLRNAFYGNEYFAEGFKDFFNAINRGYDTWDFQLFFLNLKNNSLNIHPSKNMISNIGFDERGTHTRSPTSYSNQTVHKISQLIHPGAMAFDYEADKIIFNTLYHYDDRPSKWYRTFYQKVKYKLKKLTKN
jgi:hypothetical protein